MTRDHPTTAQRSSKSLSINQPAGQNHHHNHHHHHHNQHHKVVQFEPFNLLSTNDKLLKQAAELVESASLSRFKVCVVTIVSKDSLDGSMQAQLAQAILNKSEKRRPRGKQNAKNLPKAEDIKAQNNVITNNELVNGFENQVVGHVDSKADVIVLNLSSFTDTNQLHSLYESVGLSGRDDPEIQPLLSDVWPRWNQNLIKTLLILFTLSHIIVFYNPEPSMDYSLLQMFKILEGLRLKSQARITDLLETIASNQMFPQNWIRQGRVACPRALFVCDASNLDLNITQSDVVNLKRDLEDQIYKLLKKTNILTRSTGSNQSGLLSLPEREDFVFIITKKDPQSMHKTSRSTDGDKLIDELAQREQFYSSLFKSLGLSIEESDNKDRDVDDSKEKQLSEDDVQLSQDENELSNVQQDESGTTRIQSLVKSGLNLQQTRFRKFLNRHISDLQAAIQIDQENKNLPLGKATANLLFPRYDDFFTVLLRLKNLFFPYSCDQQPTRHQQSNDASASSMNWLNDEPPDERRFVDIFDLVNTDELFSKRHCHKTRLAAFDYYCRDLRVQACVPPLTRAQHENILESAKRLYLNHARGSVCALNLDLLIDQCKLYWENLSHSKQTIDDCKDSRFSRNNRLCKTMSSDVVPSAHNSCQTSSMQSSKPNLSIIRRNNGVKIMTSCDCGRQTNFMITPVDRKKKLERVDIHRVND